MKKALLLITVLFLTALISHAQTEKGSQTLGLNLGFSYSKGNTFVTDPNSGGYYRGTNQTTNFNIGPAYSYFIADKTDIGGYFSCSLNNTNYPYSPNSLSKISAHGYAGGVFLRKYFMFGSKIGIRTGPYLDYNRVDNHTIYQPAISGNSIYSNLSQTGDIGMLLDLVYYPVKNFGFAARIANLAFSHYVTHDSFADSSSGNGVNFNLISSALSLSVVYAFAK